MGTGAEPLKIGRCGDIYGGISVIRLGKQNAPKNPYVSRKDAPMFPHPFNIWGNILLLRGIFLEFPCVCFL